MLLNSLVYIQLPREKVPCPRQLTLSVLSQVPHCHIACECMLFPRCLISILVLDFIFSPYLCICYPNTNRIQFTSNCLLSLAFCLVLDSYWSVRLRWVWCKFPLGTSRHLALSSWLEGRRYASAAATQVMWPWNLYRRWMMVTSLFPQLTLPWNWNWWKCWRCY